MLDHFAIFTSGGIVLWALSWAKLKGTPLNDLIKTVLLEVMILSLPTHSLGKIHWL